MAEKFCTYYKKYGDKIYKVIDGDSIEIHVTENGYTSNNHTGHGVSLTTIDGYDDATEQEWAFVEAGNTAFNVIGARPDVGI